jgi:predicted NBD/HSP70 family sugar kinase
MAGGTGRNQAGERKQANGQFAGTGQLLSLIMSGSGLSRAALVEASHLSRATVAQRLSYLFDIGLVTESDDTLPSGGRPARVLRLNTNFGIVLTADIGESRIRVGATDLKPRLIAEGLTEFDLRAGPDATLSHISEQLTSLLKRIGHPDDAVLGIGVSLPAPVDFASGKVVGPSIMTGWDGFDICGWLAARHGVATVADNDVNLLALCEYRTFWQGVDHLFFVKAGTGIGSGIVAGGTIYRGANGAAGDIGHIQLGEADGPLCRCGKLGCVEARAAGWAIARDLRAQGIAAHSARDVVALTDLNRPEAVKLVRESGRVIGEAVSDSVSILNPGVIVIGGTLALARDHLLSGIRELVYQRCLPLATRQLQIALARIDDRGGLLGAAQLVIDARMTPGLVDRMIAWRAPRQPRAESNPAR